MWHMGFNRRLSSVEIYGSKIFNTVLPSKKDFDIQSKKIRLFFSSFATSPPYQFSVSAIAKIAACIDRDDDNADKAREQQITG